MFFFYSLDDILCLYLFVRWAVKNFVERSFRTFSLFLLSSKSSTKEFHLFCHCWSSGLSPVCSSVNFLKLFILPSRNALTIVLAGHNCLSSLSITFFFSTHNSLWRILLRSSTNERILCSDSDSDLSFTDSTKVDHFVSQSVIFEISLFFSQNSLYWFSLFVEIAS